MKSKNLSRRRRYRNRKLPRGKGSRRRVILKRSCKIKRRRRTKKRTKKHKSKCMKIIVSNDYTQRGGSDGIAITDDTNSDLKLYDFGPQINTRLVFYKTHNISLAGRPADHRFHTINIKAENLYIWGSNRLININKSNDFFVDRLDLKKREISYIKKTWDKFTEILCKALSGSDKLYLAHIMFIHENMYNGMTEDQRDILKKIKEEREKTQGQKIINQPKLHVYLEKQEAWNVLFKKRDVFFVIDHLKYVIAARFDTQRPPSSKTYTIPQLHTKLTPDVKVVGWTGQPWRQGDEE